MESKKQVGDVGKFISFVKKLINLPTSPSLWICLLLLPGAGLAGEEEEDRLWRGTLVMEATERHHYTIKPSKDLGWRHGLRDTEKSQHVTLQIHAADPFGGHSIKASGRVRVELDREEVFGVRPPPSWCRYSWVLNRETDQGSASETIQGNQVHLLFVKKQIVDQAQALRKAITECGTDPDCLMRVQKQFQGLMDDRSKSFPIKMVVQVTPSCKGMVRTHRLRKSGRNCKSEEETEVDERDTVQRELCLPMIFEMDGTYTRGKDGDQITGTYMHTETSPYRAFDDRNHPKETSVRCRVHLSNGPPEVRIYRLSQDAPPRDITDRDEKVLVGERVRLQSEVVGTGLGEERSREWTIPELAIKSYQARLEKATLTHLPNDDLKKGIVRFAWTDGSENGLPKNVTCRVEYAHVKLEGETRFLVYEPKVTASVFDTGQDIVLAPEVEQVGWQARPTGQCEMRPDLGIHWEARVTLPEPFRGKKHCIQFVQLIGGSDWFLNKYGAPHFEWFTLQLDGLCDDTYPYCGPSCGSHETTLTLKDYPGASLQNMASGYVHANFQSYLMFRPGPRHGGDSLWVPLRKVEWKWKGATLPIGDPYDYSRQEKPCAQRYTLRQGCSRPPAASDPKIQDAVLPPEWTGHHDPKRHKPGPTRVITTDPEEPPPPQAGWSCP